MNRKLPRRVAALVVAALPWVAMSCSDTSNPAPPSVDLPEPRRQIIDAVHNDGNDHFFWLPPMVTQPDAFNGAFDGDLPARVEICEYDGASCIAAIATYTMSTGPGSEAVRVEPAAEHYIVNWHADQFDVGPGPTYRITVFVHEASLGLADIQMGSTGKEVKNLTTNETIGLKDGRTLPIKFRIEEGAVFAVGSEGGSFTTDDGRVLLMVPQGSLAEPVGITIGPWDGPIPSDQSLVANTLYDFQPDGTTFSPPAQITIEYEESDLESLPEAELAILTLVEGVWLEADGSAVDANANTVSGLIDGFSPKGVGGRVTSVDVSPVSATIEVGETVQLTADPKNAADQPVNRKVTWKSSDDAVATVDKDGLVTAVAEGPVTMEGRSGGAVGTSEITVSPIDPCANVVITFADANLEAAVRALASVPDEGPITGEIAQAITGTLDIQNSGVTSLDGLACFKSLSALIAPFNGIIDLSPLTGLVNLEILYIGANPIADLSPLLTMTGLRFLSLGGAQQSGLDFTVVGELSALTGLSVFGVDLPDLTFLSGLTALEWLSLAAIDFTDVSPVGTLTQLRDLTLAGTGSSIQSSVSSLSSLTNLNALQVTGAGLTDIGFVSQLPQLWKLNLSFNPISDFDPLGGLPDLEILSLHDAGVDDVGFLSGMTQLIMLNLRGNQIATATPLLDLNQLSDLDLTENPITCDDPFFASLSSAVTFQCNEAPTVTITSPATGASAQEGDDVTFIGTGSDLESGNVVTLSWSSDIQGDLGIGSSVTTSSLTVGIHQIGLEGTDGHGGTGTTSITITVEPAVPPAQLLVGDVLASMLDEAEFQSRYGSDWVLADGRAVVGTAYQSRTGASNVPDLRAMFLSGADPNGPRAAGSIQASDVGPHTHAFNIQPLGNNYVGGGAAPGWRPPSFNPSPIPSNDLKVQSTGGAETRPRNVAAYFYIRIDDQSIDISIHEVGVGDIVPSLLDEQSFQNQHGAVWVLADGRSAAGSDLSVTTGLANVPDLRSNFLRGVNGSRGDAFSDPDFNRSAGSLQLQEFESHTHAFNVPPLGDNYVGGGAAPGWRPSSFNPSPLPENDLQILASTGSETRPENVAVNFFIRLNEGDPANAEEQVGVGDIVASLLDEAAFLEERGEGWVIADGRSVAGSPYESLTGFPSVPDLRGRFLRGVEGTDSWMDDPGDGVSHLDGTPVPDGDPRPLGSSQTAMVGSHTHGLNVEPLGNNYVGGGAAPGWRPSTFNPSPIPDNDLRILPGTGKTVPNNVAIYFYVRIGV